MITIPTGELVGTLSDVIGLANPDRECPDTNCVRLEWDCEQLHALATDRYKAGWATWHPSHSEGDIEWGGADEPWSLTIGLDDAKHLVKTYKLSGKKHYVPLTIEHVHPGSVRIQRHRDTGHSAISTVIRDTFVEWPHVKEVLAAKDVLAPSGGFDINPRHLAPFAKVRPAGPMVLKFTGPNSMIHVSIGERFTGFVFPILDAVRLGVAPKPDSGSDFLRHGSGVHLSTEGGGDGD